LLQGLPLRALARRARERAQVNPYEPEVDWFTREPEIHSLHQGPEPKRRFMPSKWEEKKCGPGLARLSTPRTAVWCRVFPLGALCMHTALSALP